jgi:hypothetical protein
MAGPKTENPHFDEDALQNKKVSIDSSGLAHLPMQAIQYDDRKNFLNIRVWGNEVPILHMLKKSERNGGFPIAEGPDGPYGWAESLIPACNPEAQ